MPVNAAVMLVLRSPHAHARIRSIDVAAARALPGVVAVVTGCRVQRHLRVAQLPLAGVLEHMKAVSRFPMAAEVPKYEGEPVASSWPRMPTLPATHWS